MSILQEAQQQISETKRAEYGPVEESMERAALVWSGILGLHISASQVGLCMAGFKLVREAARHKRDNLVDAAGYVGLVAELEGEK